MQRVCRKQIMPKVYLTCVTTDKFKTGLYTVNLLTELSQATAALNAVLPRILRRGTANCPDMESIAAELDDLYGARIEPMVRKKGERQVVGLASDFIDDAFVPENDILERVISFVGEMLLSPATSGGRLKAEYVESEREKLLDEIRSLINDKRQYAEKRLIELMCAGEPYAVSRLGSEREASKISVYSATKQYRALLGSADVEVFYCGSALPERVERAVRESLAALPRASLAVKAGTEIVLWPKKETVREFSETFDVTQGKLAIGYRLGSAAAVPNYAALRTMNAVFGGSVTSKLFMNVREKLSLCYYASSYLDKHKNIMIVSSGIDLNKYDEALAEITRQLDAVKAGDFSDWELESAKLAIVTALRTSQDSAARLEDYYLEGAMLGLDYTPDDMAALVALVSADDVKKAAADVKADAIYFLKGGDVVED